MTANTLAHRVIEPANAVLDPAAIDRRTKNGRPKRVPKSIRHAVRLILSGEVTTIKAAAERVGISREHLSKSLSMPHVGAFAARANRQNLAEASLRASTRLVELIDAKSEHVAAQVSERILTSEGILKSDQHAIAVNVDVKAGFILDLREEPHRTIEHVPSGTDVE
jgi:hypothetical protein